MPRPSKLTPAGHDAIVKLVSNGAFVEVACESVGINTSTFYRWMKLADDPDADPCYASLRDATTRGRAGFENQMIDVVVRAAPADWRAGSWLLERLFPTRYSNMRKVELTGAGGGPITLAGLEALMGIDTPEDDDA